MDNSLLCSLRLNFYHPSRGRKNTVNTDEEYEDKISEYSIPEYSENN
jgi:hypothetical protein